MNERIRELAEQARLNVVTTTGMDLIEDGCYVVTPDRLDEFALLIVRESARVADLADKNKCEWIGGNILTHFGVEL
jgi:hypothetical protein